jgi:hypothetical protein
MATFGDGKEASVEESVAAFSRLKDFSAFKQHGCITVAQCASVVAFGITKNDPMQAVDAYFRLACLDIARGRLTAHHPTTLLPWSQYLRMMEAGMYGPSGQHTPMPDGGWLVSLDEVVRWYATHDIDLNVEELSADLGTLAADFSSPVLQELPAVSVPAGNVKSGSESVSDWTPLARRRADQIWLESFPKTSPSKENIGDRIAAEWAEQGITGKRGRLSGATITREALTDWKRPKVQPPKK